jgi:hypothetical protein
LSLSADKIHSYQMAPPLGLRPVGHETEAE